MNSIPGISRLQRLLEDLEDAYVEDRKRERELAAEFRSVSTAEALQGSALALAVASLGLASAGSDAADLPATGNQGVMPGARKKAPLRSVPAARRGS